MHTASTASASTAMACSQAMHTASKEDSEDIAESKESESEDDDSESDKANGAEELRRGQRVRPLVGRPAAGVGRGRQRQLEDDPPPLPTRKGEPANKVKQLAQGVRTRSQRLLECAVCMHARLLDTMETTPYV